MLRRLLTHVRRYPVREVYWRQLYFSGVQSWPLALLAGAVVGTVLVVLVRTRFAQNTSATLNILAVSTLQELAPLLVCLLFIARSASALATEMATMQVTGELALLRRWQISVTEYLIVPRVVAAAASCALLYVYFSVAALLAGALASVQPDSGLLLAQLASTLPLALPALGLLKSMLFGASTALIACLIGRLARNATTEIPRLASHAVLHGVIVIFVLDAVFIVLSGGGV